MSRRREVALAGLEVAGRAGIDAVSFRRVAHKVGIGPMSLYTHVGSKDDLLLAMVEAVEPDVATALASAPWRADVVRVLCELVLVNHLHGLGLDIGDLLGRLTVEVPR